MTTAGLTFAAMFTVVVPVALSLNRTASLARNWVTVPALTRFQLESAVFQAELAAPVQ